MDLQSLHTMVQNTSNDGDYLQQALNSKLPTVLAGCRDISEIEPCITDALEIASPEVKESIFTGGIALLLAFVQNAFTGPSLALSGTDILHEDFDRESAQKSSLQMLETDGELAYSLTPEPFLLYVASVILVVNRANFAKFKTGPWWAYRCAFVHQKILDNFSDSLSHIITESLDACSQGLLGVEGDRELHIRILMEKGLVHHYYTRDTEAKSWFIKAQECSKLKWSLTGALGKRTKHQTFEVSQLVVIAESHVDSPEDTKGSAATPSQLDLNCDTLLEKIEFSKLDDGSIPDAPSKLNVTDQCILLAFCLHLKNTNPEDGLTTEQMLPYVQRVLQNPNNWMVYTMALLIKSRLESHKSRTVERSVLQLQALVDQFEVQECSVGEKMDHFFTIELPPKWDLEVCTKSLQRRICQCLVVIFHL